MARPGWRPRAKTVFRLVRRNKEGVVAWIGHPMALQETVLNEMLDGTYDLAKAAVDFEKQQKRN